MVTDLSKCVYAIAVAKNRYHVVWSKCARQYYWRVTGYEIRESTIERCRDEHVIDLKLKKVYYLEQWWQKL
jgi:hypothetical protein